MNERGWDIVRLQLPALLTVLKDINIPRIPKLHDARLARRAEIPIWKPEDIGADADKIGLKSSPTQVVRTAPPPPRGNVTRRLDGPPEDIARALCKELRGRGFVQEVKAP